MIQIQRKIFIFLSKQNPKSKMMINVERTGHILYVKKYTECVTFYKKILELEILFEQDGLTCFNFYGSYLMIEKEDRKEYLEIITSQKSFSCIRMNVSNVKQVANILLSKNVQVDYNEYSWGIIAKFFDPDGNLLAFKDEEGFLKQIQEYKSI